MEADDSLLHPADDRRDHTHLSRALPPRWRHDGSLRSASDPIEPRADELLLRLPHCLPPHRLLRRSAAREGSA